MANSRAPKGLLLSGQWRDCDQCQEVGPHDRSAGPGRQVGQEHGEGEQPRGHQGEGQVFITDLLAMFDNF